MLGNSLAEIDNSWVCQHCTLRNHAQKTRCSACEARRPLNGWVCQYCTLRNHARKNRCNACEARRPLDEITSTMATSADFSKTEGTKSVSSWLQKRKRKRKNSKSTPNSKKTSTGFIVKIIMCDSSNWEPLSATINDTRNFLFRKSRVPTTQENDIASFVTPLQANSLRGKKYQYPTKNEDINFVKSLEITKSVSENRKASTEFTVKILMSGSSGWEVLRATLVEAHNTLFRKSCLTEDGIVTVVTPLQADSSIGKNHPIENEDMYSEISHHTTHLGKEYQIDNIMPAALSSEESSPFEDDLSRTQLLSQTCNGFVYSSQPILSQVTRDTKEYQRSRINPNSLSPMPPCFQKQPRSQSQENNITTQEMQLSTKNDCKSKEIDIGSKISTEKSNKQVLQRFKDCDVEVNSCVSQLKETDIKEVNTQDEKNRYDVNSFTESAHKDVENIQKKSSLSSVLSIGNNGLLPASMSERRIVPSVEMVASEKPEIPNCPNLSFNVVTSKKENIPITASNTSFTGSGMLRIRGIKSQAIKSLKGKNPMSKPEMIPEELYTPENKMSEMLGSLNSNEVSYKPDARVQASEESSKMKRDFLERFGTYSLSHAKSEKEKGMKRVPVNKVSSLASSITADKKEPIIASKQSLEKASIICPNSKDARLVTTGSCAPNNEINREYQNDQVAYHDRVVQLQKAQNSVAQKSLAVDRYFQMKSANPSISIGDTVFTVTFSTAGKGKPISVREESLVKAKRIFDEAGSSTDAARLSLDKHTVAAKDKSTHSIMDVGNTSFAVAFNTAGKGKPITVCGESLVRAKQIFDGCSNSVDSAPFTTAFSTAGKGRFINVREESIVKAKRIFDGNSTSVETPGSSCDKSATTKRMLKDNATNSDIIIDNSPFTFTSDKASSLNVREESLVKVKPICNKAGCSLTETPKSPLSKSIAANRVTDQRSSASSIIIGSTPFAISSSTTGRGRPIGVCEESLVKAKRLFAENNIVEVTPRSSRDKSAALDRLVEQEKPVNKSINIGKPAFSTAGKQKPIKVCAESLVKAKRIFDEAGSSTDVARSSWDKHTVAAKNKSTHSIMDVGNTSFGVAFNTAGKGKHITVCGESLVRAKQIFDGCSNSVATPGSSLYESVAVERIPEQRSVASSMSISNSPFATVFSTAGKGKSINVHEESLVKAKRIFDENSTSIESPGSSWDKSATVEGMSETKATNSEMIVDSAQFTTVFSTAGIGRSINVREESLVKAKRIFDGKSASIETPGLSWDKFAATKRMLADNATNSNMIVDSIPFTAVFSTAGKGTSINVRKESLVQANRLLDENSTSIETPGSSLDKSAAVEMITAEKRANSNMIVDNIPFTAVFNTAGKGRPINVREESLVQANRLFDGSSTAIKTPKPFRDKSAAVEKESKDSQANSNMIVNKTPFTRVFSTTDKGRSINERKEIQVKAKLIFDENNGSIETLGSPHDKSATVDRISEYQAANAKVSVDNASVAVAFNTAGKVKSINVLEDNLAKAKPIFGENNSLIKTPRSSQNNSAVVDRISENESSNSNMNVDNASVAVAFGKENLINLGEARLTRAKLPFDESTKSSDRNANGGNRKMSYCERQVREICSEALLGECRLRMFDRRKVARVMNDSVQICEKEGVSSAAIQVTSTNAINLIFHSEDCVQFGVQDNQDFSRASRVEMLKICREALIANGCDRSKLCDRWIINHTRWIIWKLAAMERKFPFLSGDFLNFHRFIYHLKRRYEKELISGQRSALRKILNKDVAPASFLILCVAQILPGLKANTHDIDGKNLSCESKDLVLELTDGWYAVKAVLDPILRTKVEKEVIKVGTKLAFSSASLIGVGDGVDPLDSSYDSSIPETGIHFVLSSNATRLATWDSRLGFVAPSARLVKSRGMLMCKNIKDIVLEGGPIPCINLRLSRVFPKLYFEKQAPGTLSESEKPSQVLTENQEFARSSEFEQRKARSAERILESIQENCAKEVDEMAPPVFRVLQQMDFADDFFLSLSCEDKSLIENWRQRRGGLIREKVQKEVEAGLEGDASLYRKSSPFVRLLVTSVADLKCEGGLLTIWNVTNQQLALLKEGGIITFHNLAVKATRYDGLIQLIANEGTPMYATQYQQRHLVESNYTPRLFHHLFRIHVNSKKKLDGLPVPTQEQYIDTAGIVIRVAQSPQNHDRVYLTDESGLILRVETSVADFSSALLLAPEICFDNFEPWKSIAFCNLQLMPFDHIENCAVAIFAHTSLIKTKDCHRLQELQRISDAVLRCATISFQAGTTMQALLRGEGGPNTVAVGRVIAFGEAITVNGPQHLDILVDCGTNYLQRWKLPSFFVKEILELTCEEDQLTTFQHNQAGSDAAFDSKWKKLRDSQSVLLRFALQKQPNGYEVRQINVADSHAVSALFLASERVANQF